ncbi:glycosyltransferase family 25 protein [Comamonas thiooxydans]|uniref:glycosyltransferase family 25 protein n=1 Tax=Comamonas thiooxydans TaxID=363952 RepID=UPI0001BB0EEE|nr:glycosyltransferase family 25 protein [Comamonas thiooxydans]ACY30860.1 glycosyl transferase, family 25 [Comamonas thiooxydans]MDO1474712.1 glycosyltransferase family 25 protein [Comamonas thiooxydans]
MSSLPIVFINLSKDAERRERMTAQFAQMGLTASRLPAVWWADLSEAEQKAFFCAPQSHGRYFKPLSNGEKGCYASHLRSWQQLLGGDAPAMVVFEDDVRLLPQLPQALAAIEALPADGSWDMIKLYGREPEKIANQGPLVAGALQLISYQRVPSFAAGYVISRSGARKMLETRMPFDRPVDVDIRFWFENDLRVYGVYPSVIALDDTSEVSSIWAQKEAPADLAQRLRKFKMKLELTWGNSLARTPHVAEVLKI